MAPTKLKSPTVNISAGVRRNFPIPRVDAGFSCAYRIRDPSASGYCRCNGTVLMAMIHTTRYLDKQAVTFKVSSRKRWRSAWNRRTGFSPLFSLVGSDQEKTDGELKLKLAASDVVK
uniref:Uncharacterized protein n=1 Tax=Coccidioides posadasii RMSCC 3488 TaxID=454284 RepID=A0A0J6EZE6_COCPO|nr:hypothetical protein CPAG_02317 [Coccidioides posadasii RMSCC 3488]